MRKSSTSMDKITFPKVKNNNLQTLSAFENEGEEKKIQYKSIQ